MKKIISGGQTGVDRSALDAAMHLNLSFGGWCPKGRIDELGLIPKKHGSLIEIEGNFNEEKENYNARTKRNIQDSDGTLIIIPCSPLPAHIQDGTVLTITELTAQNKPYFLFDLSLLNEEYSASCKAWLEENDIHTLNIAGPRESSAPGIYEATYDFLCKFLPLLNPAPSFQMS